MGHLRQISKIHLALRIFSFAVGMGLGNGLRENHSIYWTCGALPKTTSFRTASLSVQNYTNTLGTLIKKHRLIGLALVPPELGAVGYKRRCAGRDPLILVNQRDAATKEPLHLVAEPRPIAARTSAVILHTEGPHELGKRLP